MNGSGKKVFELDQDETIKLDMTCIQPQGGKYEVE